MTQAQQAAAAVDAARALLADADALTRTAPAELEAILSSTAELSRVVDALQVRLAGQIAERSKGPADQVVCRRLGHRSAKEAVASAFGIRASAARSLITLAALTAPAVGLSGGEIAAKYPRVGGALSDGDLSLAQARTIVEQLEPVAPRADLDHLARAEGALVAAATDPAFPLVPELLVIQARAYAAVLDPDGVLPSAERQRAMRSVRMRELPDGMWQLIMICPPEAAAAVKALLDAYTGPRVKVAFRDDDDPGADDRSADDRNADEPSADEPSADEPSADGSDIVDDRTPEQKKHDIILGLVQAHAASGDAPRPGGEPPTLVFTGTIDAYNAYLHSTDHPDRTLTVEHTGAGVPIETTDRLICDARIQHAVVNGAGHVLALGTTERLFNRAQRRALAARDKGCRVPGCGMPAAWCEAHHIVPWELGGPTDLDNGILVCSYHHHEIHAGRLRVEAASRRPGHWRITPELRPTDRYARTRRSSASSPSSASSAGSAGSALASVGGRSLAAGSALASVGGRSLAAGSSASSTTGALAAEAGPSRTVKLPDRDSGFAGRPRRRDAPRGRAHGSEMRLRRLVRAHRRIAVPTHPLDLGPPSHIVMRD